MVLETGGLEFKPQSPYSTACNYFCLQKSIRWTHVTQTSGVAESWLARSRGNVET
jgi:hypothetical protein